MVERVTGATEPRKTSPFFWPAEWAVEHAFWREVATRTLAGILTLLFLGIPAVLYAWRTETLKDSVAVPIVIGAIIFGGLIILYVIALLIVRAVTFRGTRKKIKTDKSFTGPIPSAAQLSRVLGDEELSTHFSKAVLERLKKDEGSYATWSTVVTVASLLASVLGGTIAFLSLTP